RAVELDPEFLQAYTGLSSVYGRSKHTIPEHAELAYECALKAYKLAPESAAANISIGAALFERGDLTGGFRHLSTAYAKDPENSATNSWMGFYYENLKNFTEAARFYEKSLELEPSE